MTDHQKLILQLEQLGIDSTQITTVFEEIEQTTKPWYKRLWQKGQTQLQHIRGEVHETKRLTVLLKKGPKHLTPEEKQEVQEQLWDILKVIPAGVIAGGNAVLPIPGTSLFTPIILAKAGLLPSRWREAHILHQLQQEEQRMRALGQNAIADQLHQITEQVEHNADLRDHQARDILHHWDENGNGIWDPEEIEAYEQACLRTHQHLMGEAANPHWFIQQDDIIFGPTTATQISLCDSTAWVRYYRTDKDCTKWVKLSDVLRHQTDDDSVQAP